MSKRHDLGYGNLTKDKVSFPLWYYGLVVSNSDPYNAGRIRVRIDGIDNDISEDKSLNDPKKGGLPWCQPLMPKFINIVPKVGETVKIAVFDYRNKKIRREYIGPVIAQQRPPDFVDSQIFPAKWRVETDNYNGAWSENAASIDGSWKIYPDIDDISILGRRNSDLILRNRNTYDELVLRVGKIDYKSLIDTDTSSLSNINGGAYPLNIKNPAYITINYSLPDEAAANGVTVESNNSLNLNNDRTHINLVAENLNLISHKGSSKRGFVNSIIKSENRLEQLKIEKEKLHPIPYGDVLWDFLSVLRPYVEGHIHKGSRREPDGDISKNNLIKWFNDNMGRIVPKELPDGTKYNEIEDCNFLSKGVKTN